jgi:hypothetical protein
MPTDLLKGKGFYLWKIPLCEGGDPARIAMAAYEAGYSHVLIKISDGVKAYNEGLVEPLVTALRALSISPWGWQYTYGTLPEVEASLAAELVAEYELDGFDIDAEAEYKTAGAQERAERYMGRLTQKMPSSVPIALASYRFPSYHPEFPFATFLRGCDVAMPQMYWQGAHNPRAQLKQCLAEYKQFGKPVVPSGAAFREHGWQATGADVTEFMNACVEFGLAGANFWEWGNAKKYAFDCWQAAGEFAWSEAEKTTTEPEEPVAGESLAARVLVNGLRVRSGPGLAYPIIDSLAAGQKVAVYGVDGSDVWVEIGSGQWSALRRGSTQYMEME